MVGEYFMAFQKIIILTTGGTIEKSYSEFDGSLKNRNSLLKRRLLSKLRLPHTEVELKEVMAKDSLYMDDADRAKVVQAVRDVLKKDCPVLILHGTDTMDQTARHIETELGAEARHPIVLTGAMRPAGFEDSDATQNFIEALMACQMANPGVYISFHNRLFPASRARKNRQKRTFQLIDE